jgi:hypothetical protein
LNMFVLLSFVWVNGKTGFDRRQTYEPWKNMSSNKDHSYLSAFKTLCSSQRLRTHLCLFHAIDDIPILISVECKARDMPGRPASRAIPGTPGIR